MGDVRLLLPPCPFPRFVSIRRSTPGLFLESNLCQSVTGSGMLSCCCTQGSSCRQFIDNWIETHSPMTAVFFCPFPCFLRCQCLRLTIEVASLLSKCSAHNQQLRLRRLLTGQQCGYFSFILSSIVISFMAGLLFTAHPLILLWILAGNGEDEACLANHSFLTWLGDDSTDEEEQWPLARCLHYVIY